MSDYLSSLVARSLRREPACEPRRPQMFEPRPEASGAPFADAANEGLASEESFVGAATKTHHSTAPLVPNTSTFNEHDRGELNEPRTDLQARTRTQVDTPAYHASPQHTDAYEAPRASETRHPSTAATDAQRTQIQPLTPASQSIHTRPSEDAPTAPVQPEQGAHPVVTVRESSPHVVARLAETRTSSHEPSSSSSITPTMEVSDRPTPRSTFEPGVDVQRGEATDSARPSVPLRPGVPSQPPLSRDNAQLREPERVAAQAPDSVETPSMKASSRAPSIQPLAAADEGVAANRQATSWHGVRPEVFDEVGMERASTVVPRVERVGSNRPTAVVDVEVIPQPRTSKPSESSTVSGTETPSEVVLQPTPSAELRPATSATRADHAVVAQSREVGFEGGRSAAREVSAEAAPTIEVTIGRIEVRAVTPPAPPPTTRQKQAPPKMSLDDYLRAHSGGRT